MKIIEMSCYIPENFLTVDDLAKHFKVDTDWIRRRTGIERIYRSKISVVDMALKAIENLSEDYESIVFVSSRGASYIPYYTQILSNLSRNGIAFGFDVVDGFNGFVKALYLSEKILRNRFNRALIVVAEKMSDLVADDDIDTFILFSDAAVAMIIEFDDEVNADYYQVQDLNYLRFLTIDSQNKLYMQGKQVYKFAVTNMIQVIKKLIKDFDPSDKVVVVPHQANDRILQAVEKKLKGNKRNIELLNYIRYFGNTGSSSIPLTLYQKYGGGNFSLKNHILVSVSGGMSALGIRWREAKEVKDKDDAKHQNYQIIEHKVSSY